jgi:hypothetical protein
MSKTKTVKRLPEKFTRNRHQFEQLRRTENTAIYLQHINGRQKAYEVIVIGVANRKPARVNSRVTWEPCQPYECYPGSEAWGAFGWTYTTLEDAKAKYDLLNDPRFEVPRTADLSSPRAFRLCTGRVESQRR